MNIVTLWHHQPHPAQTQLADYLASATFPPGSIFVWGLAPDTESSLESTRLTLIQRGHTVDVLRFDAPITPIHDLYSKHQRVTALYNELVQHLHEATALFIEDDVIPLDLNASLLLDELLAKTPESCAMVAAAYRSRPNPFGACAATDKYLYWKDLPNSPNASPIPIRWAGAGLTLFRTSALRAVIPFRFQIDKKTRWGWDIFVSADFKMLGFSMLLAPGIRGEHRCPEVIEYCRRNNCSIASFTPYQPTRTDILNKLVSSHGFTTYLEIGIGNGKNFEKICCAKKIGVDPNVATDFQMTSDAFFEINQAKFDLIFIDALHHAEQVYRDITHALSCLNAGGVIVCHDMNPTTYKEQAVPRLQRVWTGDCWKAWVRLRNECSDMEMFVVDTDYGCGIISAGSQHKLDRTPHSWDEFDANRVHWLNLISVEQFEHWLEGNYAIAQ